MLKITFNPNYVLKPDEGRALILSSLIGRNKQEGVDDTFTNIIHPIYAMILSYTDGRDYDTCVEDAASALGVDRSLIVNFINTLLDKQDSISLKSGDCISTFPPKTIITSDDPVRNRRYNSEMFYYDKIDMTMKRHYTPSSITLMVNNRCVTDCIYCYQDKRKIHDCSIPLPRIKEIIQEAKQLHVNTFDVIGGEFFLYEHWREVLKELRLNGFDPYISTKIPLKEDDIKYLAEINIHDIQISVDSLIDAHLTPSLKTKTGYAAQLVKSLRLIDKHGIKIMVHTVLTRYNGQIEDMQSIYDTIKDFKNLYDWHIVKAEPSLYPKVRYEEFEIGTESLNCIIDYLSDLKNNTHISLHFPGKNILSGNQDTGIQDKREEEAKAIAARQFFSRSFCSGLFSSLYILPNGSVNICEQLYWNNKFIVGDVKTENIIDIWNSDKAKSLYFIKQKDIPSDSKCSTCKVFNECRNIRQVCYREIIRKYGEDKWYYPDVNCPYMKD